MDLAYATKLSELTDRQREYVGYRMEGFSPFQACKKAAFEKTYWIELEEHAVIKPLLTEFFREQQKKHEVSLDEVIEGIKEGIDICKLQADGVGVVNGWEKLARLCGVAAPEKKEINITHEGQVAQIHYAELDEAKLLELVGKQRQLTIDADFEEVDDAEMG